MASCPRDGSAAIGMSPAKEEAKGLGLPPLTAADFRVYNSMAEKMDYFHEHFRRMWKTIYGACVEGRRPAGMTLRHFIAKGINLTRYLEAHHRIEETYMFPMLARRMPEFRAGHGPEAAELLRQHRTIHAGMHALAGYLAKCRTRELDLDLTVVREIMDSWDDVLHRHLDQEVEALGAERMRRYWTLDEMRAMPM